MNQLSWLIYLADVAGDVNAVCGFGFYGGSIALAGYAIAKGIAGAITYDFGEPAITPSIAKVGKALFLPVLISGIVGVITPSDKTLYAIAASELGEEVLKSETVSKATQALNAWLDQQISRNAGSPQ